ncbi:MAG: cysteine hydrolase [Candidatus Helarchaeota archaeon]|nr:cysteine hydrolase [Candidatus Helarchaeota archaeon]
MLNDFINEGASLEVPAGRKIVPTISKLLNYARDKGWSVLYLCDNHKKTDPEFKIWPPHCVARTKGAMVIDELKPDLEGGEVVIPKRRYSGFYGTDLDLWLRELNINTVILTGVLTNICIMYSSADASQRGYKVVVVKDGTAGLAIEDHEWALKQMETVHNAKVITEKEVEKEFK